MVHTVVGGKYFVVDKQEKLLIQRQMPTYEALEIVNIINI